ncbi:MAG: TonB-dependent receptor [Bacteroidales bacterium]|nr:TonB-dependent receptor [Bacteroidales bacterium]
MKKITLLTASLLSGILQLNAQTDSSINQLIENDLLEVTHKDVVITGTRNQVSVRLLPLTVTKYTHDDLERNYSLSILPTIAEQTPGLFTTTRGTIGYGVSTNAAGGIKVRGVGSGAELLVLIDGQPQYAGLMGHPIPDAYQTYMAENVEIIRGPSSLLYGSNAMGGVVNIITRKSKEDGSHTDAIFSGGSYGTVLSQVVNRTKKNKFSSIAGLNYQRTDGHRSNSEFEQYSGFLKLGYNVNKNWKINGDINFTFFDFMNPGPESEPLFDAEGKISRGLTSISLTNDYGYTSGSLRVYYDWGHHEINDGHTWSAEPRKYLYKHDDFIGGINWYQTAKLFAGNRITVGFDWQSFGGEAWNDFFAGDKKYYDKIENQNEIAGYADFRQDLAVWLTADLGVRIDNHSQSGTEIVPQGGLSFHLNPQNDIKLLVSKGFRNPTISEMYMFAANPDLKPERMMNYELSYKTTSLKGSFGANIYYIKGDNLISRGPNPNGAGFLQQNLGEFENYGFELESEYKVTLFCTIKANYSYLYMDQPVTCAPEGKFYAGGFFHYDKFSSNIGIENISGLYITTGENPEKENYTLVNFDFSFQALKWMKIFVKAENILNEKYSTYADFPMPGTTFMGGIALNL